jgi:DNA-binding transcriptional MerR regulator
MMRTRGGHARYSFIDLIALKTASRLIDAGISVQRIRQCLQSLNRLLPNTGTPLQELSLVAAGDAVLVLRSGTAFDALTGQEWILQVADLEREARLLLYNCELPCQRELSTDPADRISGKINRLSQG